MSETTQPIHPLRQRMFSKIPSTHGKSKRWIVGISADKSVIISALWKHSPMTAEEIAGEVAGVQDWTEATARTARRQSG